MNTICLNMIVKNECQSIRRLLESAKGVIDYWVIVDTGSTDGTQAIVRECLSDIPGELHERPWVNFAHNRNEALKLASKKGNYILILDADQKLMVSDAFNKNELIQDFYMIRLISPIRELFFPMLFKNDWGWQWEGVIHETIVSERKMRGEMLKTLTIDATAQDGCRTRDPNKYRKDAAVLKQAIADDPHNSRYYYYLAESYAAIHEYALALENFQIRAQMKGDEAETFLALQGIGKMQVALHSDPWEIIKSYSKAFEFDQSRPEPFFYLSQTLLQNGCPSVAYALALFALKLNRPNVMNSEYNPWITDWGLWEVIGDSCVMMKKYSEARQAYQTVLSVANVPAHITKAVSEKLRKVPRQTTRGLGSVPQSETRLR